MLERSLTFYKRECIHVIVLVSEQETVCANAFLFDLEGVTAENSYYSLGSFGDK